MTTIINTPANRDDDGGMGLGLILGIILTVFALLLFFIYGLPILRATPTEDETPTTQNIEIKLPTVPTTPQSGE